MFFAILKAVVFVGSVVYQNKKANALKAKQEEAARKAAIAADKNKGYALTVTGEAVAVPVVYGKNYLGGISVKHNITSRYTSASLGDSETFSKSFNNTTRYGSKNEYLHVQYALCHDGIEGVVGVKVNDLDYDDDTQRFTHIIRTFKDGGTADAVATANGIPSTNTFTGTSFASATFKLNRDDPQYNGLPQMGFIVEGRKVRPVTFNGSSYSLGAYSYSNNPALCLLDYLLNDDFGRGLSTSEVDLQSFYESAIVCGTTVSTGRAVSGVINGGPTTRDIPLYECNITLSSDNKIRDNIESIMNTMALAELTWSSEGKYKLLVEYPTTVLEQDALVDASHYFTDGDIIRNDVSLSWPSASERHNQITISFVNEHEDFKNDSATWPTTNSTAHTTFLTEDNNQPFVSTITADGVTDPYHALATAEQLVRESRQSRTVDLTVSKKGLSIEPGDFINLTCSTSGISDEVYRVGAIEVNPDFTVKLTCSYFDYQTLAWNVNDDIDYSTRPTFDFVVEPVTDLTYVAGTPDVDKTAIAELTWTAPTDGSFKCVVYYTVGGELQILGETTGESFVIHPRAEWADGQSVTFTVKAQTPLGRLSEGVAVTNAVVRVPDVPTSFSLAETLYQTNKASGVKARATIGFSEPVGGVGAKDFKVEYYRDDDGPTYRLLGYTVGETFVFNDIRSGDYHFRVTPISWFGYEGTSLVGTKTILGLSAIPADPTNFTSKVTDSGILFTWDTPSDLDVVSGGTTEIRYVRDDVITPNWEIAQVIVNNISGSTTTATLPIAPGYYLIKHFDSSDNACANAAVVKNSFVGPDYNVITTIAEHPTFAGTKTNCTVVGSNLELDDGFLTMTYLFDNDIDLGSVESIRLVPNLSASITDGATVVADYDPVASVTRFAGPVVNASVTFEVRTTDDDPTGSPTWSDWETFTIGNYRHRAFEFRITAVVASVTYTVSISDLSLTADKSDVSERGTSTSSASADTTVSFVAPFYGGIGGTDVPYVGCNTVGGSTSDIINITSITKDDFTYSVYNSGSRVARSITWQAVGQ